MSTIGVATQLLPFPEVYPVTSPDVVDSRA